MLAYYQSELTYLRELGAEFARDYSKVAGRIQLEASQCKDPHVERLLEGFAFLAGRVRRKIDDEFPEIAQAVLETLYPHCLRPVPSMSIVQYMPGPDAGRSAGGQTIDGGVELTSRPVNGQPCRFRATYPVTFWPIDVASARLRHDRLVLAGAPAKTKALLEISLRRASGLPFTELPIRRLRFYLDGEDATVHVIYAAILNQSCGVAIRGTQADGSVDVVPLPPGALRPVGFEDDEGMFPYPARAFTGYRLIQEYFAFPEKYLFIDIDHLDKVAGRPWGDTVDLLIFLDRSPPDEVSVDAENFKLGCTPIVNLFSKVAEPIPLTHYQSEYRVVPDVHRPTATEVFAIESVTSTSSLLDTPTTYEPLYTLQHGQGARGQERRAYWIASRRRSTRREDPGTEVFLSLVDPGLKPVRKQGESLTVRVSCTNRDLPSKLPFGGGSGDFALAAAGPVSRVRCLRKPTESIRPGLGRGAYWRLISHLSLNHLSLTDDENGLEALRALLRLYSPPANKDMTDQIEGITGVSTRHVTGRVAGSKTVMTCRGLEVSVEFDQTHFVGAGAYLFASVLERFFALYASINSFTQLVARTRNPEAILKRWQPRAGNRTLL